MDLVYGIFAVIAFLDGLLEDKFPGHDNDYWCGWLLPTGEIAAVAIHCAFAEAGFSTVGAVRLLMVRDRREATYFNKYKGAWTWETVPGYLGLEVTSELTAAQRASIMLIMQEWGYKTASVDYKGNGASASHHEIGLGTLRQLLDLWTTKVAA